MSAVTAVPIRPLAKGSVLKLWIAATGAGGRLQAGTYRFERPQSPLEVLRKIEAGEVMLQAVTLPEGLDLREIAARLAAAGFGPEEAFLRAFRDASRIRDLDPLATDLEDSLLKLLMQVVPPEQRAKVDNSGLQGPVVDAKGRSDVVANQTEVDDLLASLGF